MNSPQHLRQALSATLLSVSWWYRCSVAAVGVATIAALSKIAFGSSLANEPTRLEVVVGVLNWRRVTSRGWPWEFSVTSSDAFGQLQAGESMWHSSALAGDVIVFGAFAVGIVWLTRRIASSPQWSMRWLGVALTTLCIVGAWLANAYHHSTYDRALRRELWLADSYPTDEYADPRWFQQLVGEKGGVNELFYRLSDHQTLYAAPQPEHHKAFYDVMAKRRGLRRLWLDSEASTITPEGVVTRQSSWRDEHVAGLLKLRSLHGLEELNLSYADISSKALVDIQNCQQLQVVDLTGTRIDDEGIEYLARCPRLTVLRLNGTLITASSLPALQQISKHAAIDASNTRLTPAHLKSLRKPPKKPFGWETDVASQWKRT